MGAESETAVTALTERARRAARPGAEELEKVRIVLADALAVAFQAFGTPTQRTAAEFAARAPAGPSTALGCARGVPAETAVLVNSSLNHALLLDDVHAGVMGHPGTVVIPVALALAEELGATGEELVGAIAAGYQTFVGIVAPVAVAASGRGFRTTTLFGAAGAAAAAATLLGLDDERFAAALLIACGSAGGTLQAFRAGSPEWRFQPGVATQNGLVAARLAAALDPEQLPFPADALESESGLYAILAGSTVDWRSALAEHGSAILEVSHKVHATCGANQVPVGALSAVLRDGETRIDDIAGIDIGISRSAFEYPGCEAYGPFSEAGTFLSRPFAIAATVLAGGGPLRVDQVRAALADPRLGGLLARVRSYVIPEDELRSPQDSRVAVTLRDGTVRRAGLDDVDPLELQPDWGATRNRLLAAVPGVGEHLAAGIAGLPATSARDLLAPLRASAPEQ